MKKTYRSFFSDKYNKNPVGGYYIMNSSTPVLKGMIISSKLIELDK